MKKNFFQAIKYGLIMWFTALIVVCAGLYVFIKARSTTNPGLVEQAPTGGLYVNNGDTLTAAKRNTLVNKTSQISYDWTATAISWTLDIDYISCSVENPTKLKVYNCNGTINIATNNGSYAFYSPATDIVDLLCPTGYIAISGGWYSSDYMRESRILWWNRWRTASAWTVWNISLLCMKFK